MMADLILSNGGKEIERAIAISHADLKNGFGFDGQAQIVKPHSLRGRDFYDLVNGMHLAICSELWFPTIHRDQGCTELRIERGQKNFYGLFHGLRSGAKATDFQAKGVEDALDELFNECTHDFFLFLSFSHLLLFLAQTSVDLARRLSTTWQTKNK